METVFFFVVGSMFATGVVFTLWGALTLSMIRLSMKFGHVAPYRSLDEEVADRLGKGLKRLCIGGTILVLLFAVGHRMSQ